MPSFGSSGAASRTGSYGTRWNSSERFRSSGSAETNYHHHPLRQQAPRNVQQNNSRFGRRPPPSHPIYSTRDTATYADTSVASGARPNHWQDQRLSSPIIDGAPRKTYAAVLLASEEATACMDLPEASDFPDSSCEIIVRDGSGSKEELPVRSNPPKEVQTHPERKSPKSGSLSREPSRPNAIKQCNSGTATRPTSHPRELPAADPLSRRPVQTPNRIKTWARVVCRNSSPVPPVNSAAAADAVVSGEATAGLIASEREESSPFPALCPPPEPLGEQTAGVDWPVLTGVEDSGKSKDKCVATTVSLTVTTVSSTRLVTAHESDCSGSGAAVDITAERPKEKHVPAWTQSQERFIDPPTEPPPRPPEQQMSASQQPVQPTVQAPDAWLGRQAHRDQTKVLAPLVDRGCLRRHSDYSYKDGAYHGHGMAHKAAARGLHNMNNYSMPGSDRYSSQWYPVSPTDGFVVTPKVLELHQKALLGCQQTLMLMAVESEQQRNEALRVVGCDETVGGGEDLETLSPPGPAETITEFIMISAGLDHLSSQPHRIPLLNYKEMPSPPRSNEEMVWAGSVGGATLVDSGDFPSADTEGAENCRPTSVQGSVFASCRVASEMDASQENDPTVMEKRASYSSVTYQPSAPTTHAAVMHARTPSTHQWSHQSSAATCMRPPVLAMWSPNYATPYANRTAVADFCGARHVQSLPSNTSTISSLSEATSCENSDNVTVDDTSSHRTLMSTELGCRSILPYELQKQAVYPSWSLIDLQAEQILSHFRQQIRPEIPRRPVYFQAVSLVKRLSEEVTYFQAAVDHFSTQVDGKRRQHVINLLAQSIRNFFVKDPHMREMVWMPSNVRVSTFGSVRTRLALPWSDIDLVLTGVRLASRTPYNFRRRNRKSEMSRRKYDLINEATLAECRPHGASNTSTARWPAASPASDTALPVSLDDTDGGRHHVDREGTLRQNRRVDLAIVAPPMTPPPSENMSASTVPATTGERENMPYETHHRRSTTSTVATAGSDDHLPAGMNDNTWGKRQSRQLTKERFQVDGKARDMSQRGSQMSPVAPSDLYDQYPMMDARHELLLNLAESFDVEILSARQREGQRRSNRGSKQELQSLGEWIDVIFFIPAEVMPLLTLQMSKILRGTTIQVDISVADKHHTGLQTVDLVEAYLGRFSTLRPIMMILKQLLHNAKLNKPFNGGLASYSLFLMLTAFLLVPRLYDGREHDVGYQLLNFLAFYSEMPLPSATMDKSALDLTNFKVSKMAIVVPRQVPHRESSLTTPVFTSIPEKFQAHPQCIVIVDPCNPSNNVGRPTFNYTAVVEYFRQILITMMDQACTCCPFTMHPTPMPTPGKMGERHAPGAVLRRMTTCRGILKRVLRTAIVNGFVAKNGHTGDLVEK